MRYGRASVKIIAECLNYGIPAPIFNYDFASFSIEFEVAKESSIIPKETSSKETIFLTDNQKKIIELIKENESITHIMLSKETGISTKSIYLLLKTLKEKKMIERIGSDKNGKWRVM